MTTQAISARGLWRETFTVFDPIYVPLLVITSPNLTLELLNSIGLFGSKQVVLDVIYLFFITPLLSGASFFYTYRSLSGNAVNVEEAFKQANRNIVQLIVGCFLYIAIFYTGLILLIIPGIYLGYRLVFVLYAIALENSLAIEGLSSSWKLTKGHWWLIFRCGIPIILVIFLIYPTGKSILVQIVSGIIQFLIMPFIEINFVLLYMRLKDIAANI